MFSIPILCVRVGVLMFVVGYRVGFILCVCADFLFQNINVLLGYTPVTPMYSCLMFVLSLCSETSKWLVATLVFYMVLVAVLVF